MSSKPSNQSFSAETPRTNLALSGLTAGAGDRSRKPDLPWRPAGSDDQVMFVAPIEALLGGEKQGAFLSLEPKASLNGSFYVGPDLSDQSHPSPKHVRHQQTLKRFSGVPFSGRNPLGRGTC